METKRVVQHIIHQLARKRSGDLSTAVDEKEKTPFHLPLPPTGGGRRPLLKSSRDLDALAAGRTHYESLSEKQMSKSPIVTMSLRWFWDVGPKPCMFKGEKENEKMGEERRFQTIVTLENLDDECFPQHYRRDT
jgi:hypothetical protein